MQRIGNFRISKARKEKKKEKERGRKAHRLFLYNATNGGMARRAASNSNPVIGPVVVSPGPGAVVDVSPVAAIAATAE